MSYHFLTKNLQLTIQNLSKKIKPFFLAFLLTPLFIQCKNSNKDQSISSFSIEEKNDILLRVKPTEVEIPEGMAWIPGGEFQQGASESNDMALNHEKPQHPVAMDGFFMDETEVTNAQFKKFVEETGYVTVAEREIDWEEMKKQVPPGTPKPHDSILQPGSLVFKKASESVPNLYDFSQWWDWKIGANWKHPQGPESDIEGKDDYPVVHIAYEDAEAYCKWAGRRLPTEAQWEYAAKGGLSQGKFSWGDDDSNVSEKANTWEGEFPTENTKGDGFENKAPVKSYPPNNYGLYDMAGNVWEITQDWYNINYYEEVKGEKLRNPKGAQRPYNPNNPQIPENVIKGGSFLCSASYCASYRPSARMGNSLDSAQEHLGFRTVATPEMVGNSSVGSK